MFFYYVGITLALYYLFLMVRFLLQTRESIKGLIQEMIAIRRSIDSVQRSMQKLESQQAKMEEETKVIVCKANEVMRLSHKTGQEMNTGLKTALSMARSFNRDTVSMTLACLDKIFDAIKDSPLLEHKGGEEGMLGEVGEMLRTTNWNDSESDSSSSSPPPALFNTRTNEFEDEINKRLDRLLSSDSLEASKAAWRDMKMSLEESGISLVATNSGLELRSGPIS